MRPVPLAGLFASIGGTVNGFINVLWLFWARDVTADTYRVAAVGTAEALVPLLTGLATLAAAWLLVAVGMRRVGDGSGV
jgi:hypothetical protein